MRTLAALALLLLACDPMPPANEPPPVDAGPDSSRVLPPPLVCDVAEEGIPCVPEEACCFCCTDHNGRRACRLHWGC